jgi:hypothetical protein
MTKNNLGGIKSYTTQNNKTKNIKDGLISGWACRQVGKRMIGESMFSYSCTLYYVLSAEAVMAGNMMVCDESGGTRSFLSLDLSSHNSDYEKYHLLKCNAV